MKQEYLPKPIDKEYLKSSLKNFNSNVLSKKYLPSDDKQLHTHANQALLEKLGISDDGMLLFDGNRINKEELLQLFENDDALTAHMKQETARAKEAERVNADNLLAEQDRAYSRENEIERSLRTEAQTIRQLIDLAYANSNGYTDEKISGLINGAPSTLDTLKEIADAISENESVVQALDHAIGSKAAQAELDTHIGNDVIHVTQTDKANWDTPAFTEAPVRSAIESSETLSRLFGKIKKWLSDLKTVAFTGSYDDLTNKPDIPDLSASAVLPKAPGTAAVGTETGFARGDHVHPLQTSVTGNAGTATKLQTARKINGVAFDGSDDITITIGTTLTATLPAGETTLTFTDDAITDDSIINVYTDRYGVSPSSAAHQDHSLMLTFHPQENAVRVKVQVM